MYAAGLDPHTKHHCGADAAVTAVNRSPYDCQLTLSDTPTTRGSHHATLVASVDGSALDPGEQAGLAIVAKESSFLPPMLVREAAAPRWCYIAVRERSSQTPAPSWHARHCPISSSR